MAPEGYSIETVDLPDVPEMEIGGIETRQDGTVVASTRGGSMWEYDPESDEWSPLTNSLHTALGVWIDDDTDDVFTAQMPRLSRLVDETDDGTIDWFETITQEWGFSGNYHEFAYGPVRDDEGNFYVTLNLTHGGDTVKSAIMGHGAPYRGWAVQITSDGEFVPYASGLRSPAGIGINEDDEVFFTDNQGDYMPTNHFSHLREGEYYGHPGGLYDHPNFEDEDLNAIPDDEYDQLRTDHAVWIPYSESNATTGIAFEEVGNFGPFEGQVFLGELTQSKVLRVSLEEVDGHYQGAVFNFADGFQSGPIDVAFSPDGESLWVGQADRGWGAVGGDPYALQRIEYDGETIPFEMKSVSIQPSGFVIEFTEPVDPDAASDPDNYDVNHWTYNNDSSYGSDLEDYVSVNAGEIDVTVVDDHRVEVDLSEIYVTPEDEEGLVSGTRVYELGLSGIESVEGEPLEHNQAWYTVNHLPADVGLTADTEQLDEEMVSVTGRLETPREPLTDGELALTAADESLEVTAETTTTFDELSAGETFEVEWTVSVPETGEYDLELHASYVEDEETKTTSTPVPITVFPFPESVAPNEIGVGAQPSSDGVVLWDGDERTLDDWESQGGGDAEWIEHDDYFEVNLGTGDIQTLEEFGDCHLHVEWRAPEDSEGSGQGRTNSGVFLMDRYEFQVLDNYENPTYGDGWAGSYYAQAPPLVSPLRPPGEWQAYDILWRGPRFDDDGELIQPAQATVLLNGVVVLAHLDIEGPNLGGSVGEYEPHSSEEPLRLQDHNDITGPHYRNIWYRPLREGAFEQQYAPLDPDYDFSLYGTTAGTDDVQPIAPGGPGTGDEPPADAEPLLEDGLDGWENVDGGEPGWNEADDYVEVEPGAGDIQTEAEFGDTQVHLEWRILEDVEGERTDRGNSGALMMGQYQIQLLDNNGNPVDPVQWAGAYPDQAPPQVSPIRSPGEWQTLDIFWQGPRFDGVELSRPARATVLLNETVVQARLVPDGPNPDETVEEYQTHSPTGPLRLQEYGDPVQFRNIWSRDLDPDADPGEPPIVDDFLSVPFGMDCGGAHTDETVTIDGLEFHPAPEVAQDIDMNLENRQLTPDEIWWPEAVDLEPNPNSNAETYGAEWGNFPDIDGTENDSLYQTEHWANGELSYTFHVENGTYDVTLHFAEIVQTAEDARVFSASINGEPVVEDLDLFAEYGPTTAATYTAEAVDVDDNQLVVELESSVENPKISGIEIRETPVELLSAPYAMDCGGAHTDETVTIDGLEFDPSPEVAQEIDLGCANRALTEDEIWWPEPVEIEPNPNSYSDGCSFPEIDGTEHDTLYQTEHWAEDELSYTFHIENGVYDVTLHFSEINDEPGTPRIFDVIVQGETVIEDLRPIDEAGSNTAIVETIEGVEVTDEVLTITGDSSSENPKFSAIEIREAEEEPDELLSIPYGMDCGGSMTDDTVEIDGLEYDPDPSVSQGIDIGLGDNRPLDDDEIWWPNAVAIKPNPNVYGQDVGDVDNTDHDPLYWTEHWAEGELGYTFAVENGTYDVTLHFSEIGGDNERIFDVMVQGEPVIELGTTLADVAGGTDTAFVETIEEIEVTDEELTIEAVSSQENPKFSAIEIRESEE